MRQRVIKLAQLCTQGLLTPGRPLEMARGRLLALVTRHGFEAMVVSDIADPAERKRELASLQELLAAVPPPEHRTGEQRGSEGSATEAAQTRLLDHGGMAGSGAGKLTAPPSPESRVCPSCFAPGFTDSCPTCGYRHVPSQRDGFILAPNTMLTGRYRIGRVLGLGGFGITYVGRDERLHALVAVKEYYPSMFSVRMPGSSLVAPSGPEQAGPYRVGMEKFLDEARLLAQFRNTAEIVDVLDFFTENGTAYMVMEYLEGRSLQEVLNDRGGRLPFGEALSVILPVMRGLSHVHDKNVLHRDISPDNIYITSDKRSKLLDFGAARMAISQGEQNLTVILKRGYAPLEQYNAGGRQGPWTDVYALCATLLPDADRPDAGRLAGPHRAGRPDPAVPPGRRDPSRRGEGAAQGPVAARRRTAPGHDRAAERLRSGTDRAEVGFGVPLPGSLQAASKVMLWAPFHRASLPISGSFSRPDVRVMKWLPASWPILQANWTPP